MQIVIDLPEEIYMDIKEEVRTKVNTFEHIPFLHEVISVGTPLPKGHGRLGDLGALEKEIETYSKGAFAMTPEFLVKDAPTIIEADTIESEDNG